MKRIDKQKELIIDQFTKQSVTFSGIPGHSGDITLRCLTSLISIANTDVVLDVACGPGIFTCAIAPLAKQITGIDLVPAMLEKAKSLQAEKKIENINWDIGDVMPLPYADSSFSIVVTRYSFHHFMNPGAVLSEMTRVAKKQGKVVVIDVFTASQEQSRAYDSIEKMRDPSHVHTLPLDSLQGLFKKAGLINATSKFYRVEIDLEQQIKASFPKESDIPIIRKAALDDIGKDQLGWGAFLKEGKVCLSLPIAVIAGEKV